MEDRLQKAAAYVGLKRPLLLRQLPLIRRPLCHNADGLGGHYNIASCEAIWNYYYHHDHNDDNNNTLPPYYIVVLAIAKEGVRPVNMIQYTQPA